jgi:hypothetical protein
VSTLSPSWKGKAAWGLAQGLLGDMVSLEVSALAVCHLYEVSLLAVAASIVAAAGHVQASLG